MVYDLQTAVYVPVFYVLMTGKTESLYWHALDWIYVASKRKLDPFSVTCDFEKALHNAVRGQFPNSILNGCLFHWKQAIRRKMIEYKIDSEQIKLAMTQSVLDILTVIPRDEIMTKGIDYVRDILDAACKSQKDTRKWDSFFDKYFKKYWCSSDEFIKTWNICDSDEKYKELQNRTNNALERYNRTMNEKFPCPHPSLKLFVVTLEEEGRDQVTKLENIRYGKVVPLKHQDLTIANIPDCYLNFKK